MEEVVGGWQLERAEGVLIEGIVRMRVWAKCQVSDEGVGGPMAEKRWALDSSVARAAVRYTWANRHIPTSGAEPEVSCCP